METKEWGLDPESNGNIVKVNGGGKADPRDRFARYRLLVTRIFTTNRGCITFDELIEAMTARGYFFGAQTRERLHAHYCNIEREWLRNICEPQNFITNE